MDGMFGLLVAPVVGSIAYLILWAHSRSRTQAWREAAEAAGLANIESSTFLGLSLKLTGSADGLDVKVESYSRGKHEHGTRIVIGGLRHGAGRLSVRAEGVTSAIQKTLGHREIEAGDPAFDSAAYLQGDPALIRALFDAETRRLMGPLLEGRLRAESAAGAKTFKNLHVSVSDNELRVEIRSSLFDRTETWLPSVLPRLLAIGHRLRRPDDVAARLAANARGEALEAVRLANLRVLTSDFSGQPVTRETLVAALGDGSVEVRLHAAIALGPDGQELLRALATGGTPGGVAARAIAALGPAFSVQHATARLREACRAMQDATALACIEILGDSGESTAIGELVETLGSSGESLAAAAARALGRLGHAAAETPLVAALGHESEKVRVASAEALGHVGTPQAVASLREASESFLPGGELRRATRQAIAEIQSRVTGASPGQLSLAEERAGQVTLVDEDTRGRLSLEQEEQTQRARQAGSARRVAQ